MYFYFIKKVQQMSFMNFKWLKSLVVSAVLLASYSQASYAQNKLPLVIHAMDSSAKSMSSSWKLNDGYANILEAKLALELAITDMHNLGFLAASIDSLYADSLGFHGIIFGGKQYHWSEIRLDSIAKQWSTEIGIGDAPFARDHINPKKFRNVVNQLLNYGENHGYPFASVSLKEVDQNQEGCYSGLLTVRKYREFTIDSIRIEGTSKISKRYIYNYLGIHPGDLYREKSIASIRNKMQKLSFVKQVKTNQLYFIGNRVIIVLYLDHRKTDQVDGIIGFAPNADTNEGLLITGEANIDLKNVLNRGAGNQLHWKSFDEKSQQLRMGADIPYILQRPIGIDGNFDYLKFDTQFYTVKTRIGFRYIFNGDDYFRVYMQNSQSALLQTDTSQIRSTKTLPTTNPVDVRSYGVKLSRNKVDNPFNPRKGFQIFLDGNIGTRKIVKDIDIERVILFDEANQPYNVYDSAILKTVQAEFAYRTNVYLPVGKKSTIVAIVDGKQLLAPNVFINDLYRFGGTNSLRGFNEESLLASAYTMLALEYRYLFGGNAFFQVFANGAYMEDRSSVDGSIKTDYPFGFGVGVHLEVNSGILKLAYALGTEQDNKLQLSRAKIHFGIINYL